MSPPIDILQLSEEKQAIAGQILKAFENEKILPTLKERLAAHKRIILPGAEFLECLEIESKNLLENNPDEFFKICNLVIRQHMFSLLNWWLVENPEETIPIRLKGWPNPRPLTNLLVNDIGRFGGFIGQILYRTETIPHPTKAIVTCPNCYNTITVVIGDVKLSGMKVRCSCSTRFISVVSSQTTYVRQNMCRLMLEPLSDHQNIGSSILCNLRDDLCKENVLKMLDVGSKVIINGKVCSTPPKPTEESSYFIEANYIENVDKSGEEIAPTEEELREISTLRQKPNLIEFLAEQLFDDSISGMNEIKQSFILSLVGGISTPPNRRTINLMLVGEPSTAKSYMLHLTKTMKLHPIMRYTSGTHSTIVGLTGGVIKDEALGKHIICPGALALANNGVCLVDEFDKFPKEDQAKLNDAIETGEIEINKIVKGKLRTNAAVIATLNPIGGGSFDEYKNKEAQIGMVSSLLTRFDLIFFLEHPKGVDREKVALMIANRYSPEFIESQLTDRQLHYSKLCKKLFSISRTVQAHMSEDIRRSVVDYDKRLIAMENTTLVHKITVRYTAALCRLAEVRARLYGRQEIDATDLEFSFQLLMKNLMQLGHTPAGKEFSIINGAPHTETVPGNSGTKNVILRILEEHGRQKIISIEELFSIVKTRNLNITKIEFDIAVDKLHNIGHIMYPRPGEVILL